MYRILLVEDDEALRYVYAHMHAWQENGGCLAAQAVVVSSIVILIFNLILTQLLLT